MQNVYSAGIVVFREEQKRKWYLLLHYTQGHWDFPKGRIEQGETKEEAALRELKEETGLTAQIVPPFSHDFSYFFMENGKLTQKTVTFFIGQTKQKKVTLSQEHTDYEWLPFGEAYARLTYENAKKLLIKVDERIGHGHDHS